MAAYQERTISADEMSKLILEDVKSEYQLYVGKSKIKDAGFGLFAGKEIPAGTEIFRVTPAAFVIDHSVGGCDFCAASEHVIDPTKTAVHLTWCNGCKAVQYCSKDCQKKAWKRYHEAECKLFIDFNNAGLKSDTLSLGSRLLIRLVILKIADCLDKKQWDATNALRPPEMVMNGESNGQFPGQVGQELEFIAKMFTFYLEWQKTMNLNLILQANQHHISPSSYEVQGNCLVPSASIINHDCNPNSIFVSEECEFVVRSNLDIEKDKEITTTYTTTVLPFQDRQKKLGKDHLFTCRCSTCLQGFEAAGEIRSGNEAQDRPITRAEAGLKGLLRIFSDKSEISSVDISSTIKRMQEICSNPKFPVSWPIGTHPVPALFATLADKAEGIKDWRPALMLRLKLALAIDRDRINTHRVDHLFDLWQLEEQIALAMEAEDSSTSDFASVAKPLYMMLHYHHLQVQKDAEDCFGKSGLLYIRAKDNTNVISSGKWKNWIEEEVLQSYFSTDRYENLETSIGSNAEAELCKWLELDLKEKYL